MRNLVLFLLNLLFLLGCSEIEPKQIQEPSPTKPLIFTLEDFILEGDTSGFMVSQSIKELEPNLQLITYSFKSSTPKELKPVSIKFNFPSINIGGYWNPRITVDKINYWGSSFTSRASRNAPVLTYYSPNLRNRLTFALSDALNMIEIGSYLKEEDVHFHPSIRMFKERMPKTTDYTIELRLDTRDLPYYQSIDEVASWWAEKPEYRPMTVPDEAKMPMYSTWYSYHQNVSHESIVAECKIARNLGCTAVIVDDGWQTLDSNRGYAYVGDWLPERIPDMKGLVDAVHAEEMDFILWYSLPFMGEKAKNFSRFKGKYLRYWESQETYIMDPRYPEIREYIIATFEKALLDWQLDGFKIDFIGRFSADETTVLTLEDGRDFASVNEATDFLMTSLTKRLQEIKPDILIEFRQPYIGPLMRKYGNMFRGVDAPNNAIVNRINITNLKIMSQSTAVHSDMFIWRPEETAEQAALQILNILYSVPQLSVKLDEVPEEHLKMIKHWFGYWIKNREILLDGTFIPSNPGANYQVLSSTKDGHQISTIYENVVIQMQDDLRQLDIINAKPTTQVLIYSPITERVNLEVKNCLGDIIQTTSIRIKEGINEINLPPSGIGQIKF